MFKIKHSASRKEIASYWGIGLSILSSKKKALVLLSIESFEIS